MLYSRWKAYSNNTDGYEKNCPFCWDIDSDVLFVDEFWTVIENKYPYPNTKEHLLVIPHRHISAYSELHKNEWEDLRKILTIYFDRGYFLFGRQYPNQWASVKHLHIHLTKW